MKYKTHIRLVLLLACMLGLGGCCCLSCNRDSFSDVTGQFVPANPMLDD